MRLGIRTKLVGTLVLAGLFPLALALGTALLAVRQTRARFIGQSFRAMARQQAEHLGTLLSAQIEYLKVMSQLPGTALLLEEANKAPELTGEQIEAIEARWPMLTRSDSPLREILENPVARSWQTVQEQHHPVCEVIITDRTGRLVASSNITTDYFQGDEEWWQNIWADGRGQVTIRDVVFDPTAVSSTGKVGIYVVNVGIPLYPTMRGAGEDRAIGVLRVSLEAQWLLHRLASASRVGPRDEQVNVWVVNPNGRPIQGPAQLPPFEQLPDPLRQRVAGEASGYAISKALADHEVVGFARVDFSETAYAKQIEWRVLITAARQEVLASTRNLLWILLLAGVAFIALCFVSGLFIARREVLRPLKALGRGARELEAGNFAYRLRTGGTKSVFRDDELGKLARDFNRMAEHMEKSMADLAAANFVKEQFIDLASHELRTPITYILGVAELAQRKGGPEAPLLSRIGVKAQRLNRIAENMFKLLHSGSFEGLNITAVELDRLINAVAGELEPFLKSRNQILEVIAPEIPPIPADADKVRDILNNLVTNAIRFSPDGALIRIEVAEKRPAVEITVTDQGPGIPPEDMPRLFEPFFTGSANLPFHSSGEFAYMTRGMGLGLSVVKRFVEMHGGTVSVESSINGTLVRVTLPKDRAAPTVISDPLPHPHPHPHPQPQPSSDSTC